MTLKNTPTNFSHKFKALQLTFQVVIVTFSCPRTLFIPLLTCIVSV